MAKGHRIMWPKSTGVAGLQLNLGTLGILGPCRMSTQSAVTTSESSILKARL